MLGGTKSVFSELREGTGEEPKLVLQRSSLKCVSSIQLSLGNLIASKTGSKSGPVAYSKKMRNEVFLLETCE